MNGHSIERFFSKAIEVSHEAGKIIVGAVFKQKDVDTKIGPWDLVTEFDKRCEKTIIGQLKEAFPDHKFIGEESCSDAKYIPKLTEAPTWVIDPIDGTTNFVHGLPLTCISIALVINYETVLGIVYNPILNQEFTAIKGFGAKLNGKPINTSSCTDIEQALLCHETSFARIEEIREREINRLRAMVSKAHGVRSIGSAAVTLCYVAWGALDAYHIDGLQSWDVAAGDLIVREAGGCVISSDGSKFDMFAHSLIAASTKTLAHELVEIIAEADQTE